MRLNKFLWNSFLESAQGREWVSFFSQLRTNYAQRDKCLAHFINTWATHGTLDQHQPLEANSDIDEVLAAIVEIQEAIHDGLLPKSISNRGDAEIFYREIGDLETCDDNKREDDEDLFFLDDVPKLSVALFCLYPKFFFPYYFYPNFQALKKIFDEFGIFLPPVPPKRNYEARFYYYLELCRSLYDFWSALGFNPEHLPVFLYGFAPEMVELNVPPIKALPKPHRAWFVGGGIDNNGDFDYLDKVGSSSQTFWQGNKDSEVGDIVVMYCLTPRSHVHSIWRVVRPGSIEPFRAFYGTIWMGYPQLVKGLTLAEMKADPILSAMPLVKGNMQGINGRQIHKRFYDRLLCLLEKKGTKLEKLPALENLEIKDVELETERDVELNLLEPLLEELGFNPNDWERQVTLRVGRSEKVIPDYLILPSKVPSSRSIRANWVWEAKLCIASNDQLLKDFAQVSSYARLVGAAGVGLISREGAWLSLKIDDYCIEKARHWSAHQLREVDHLNEVREIAGKKRISSTRK